MELWFVWLYHTIQLRSSTREQEENGLLSRHGQPLGGFWFNHCPSHCGCHFFFFFFPAKHQVTQTKPQPISNISPSFLRALCTGSAGSLGNHRITQVEGTLGILYSNLFHCLAVLRVKKLFFISYLNLILSVRAHLSSFQHASPWTAWFHLLENCFVTIGRLLLHSPEDFFSPGFSHATGSSLSWQAKCSKTWQFWQTQ